MHNVRIIARLDIKGPNLVKGIHLEGLRVLGRPEDFAQYYYETGADELMYMDVVASLYERNSLNEIIVKTAREIFVPLTVGGGLRSIDDINAVLRAGADKVSLNTAAVRNPALIEKAARRFGSSTIVIAIEAIRQPDGRYLIYTDNGREFTGIDAIEWARRAEQLGAGEIVATSVDREGTGTGFDVVMTRLISEQVSIPVIAHGGAGRLTDISAVVTEGRADAVAISSMLHYERVAGSAGSTNGRAEGEGNTEFLRSGRAFVKVEPRNLLEIRTFLQDQGIGCRTIKSK